MSSINTDRSLSIELVRPNYGPRLLGLGLSFLAIASVLFAQHAPWWVWLGPVLYSLAWPHLAWYRTRSVADPRVTEHHNLLVDHFAGGLWMAAIAFNALPSALIFALASTNSMSVGGLRLFLRGAFVQVAGVGVGLFIYGITWQPTSTMTQVLACLPLVVIYPPFISHITYRAIRKFRNKQQELAYQNQHDSLSGLYNRRHWDASVQAEFLRFQRTGDVATLVMMDFDHFKRINDTLGHQVGDEVIRRFSSRLRDSLRRTDSPGRYGGEEFCILLPHTSSHAAELIMQRFRQSLHDDPLLEQRRVTVSIGIAALTPDFASHEAWVRLADQMLYRAKYQGRDRVVTAGVDQPALEQVMAHVKQEWQRDGVDIQSHVLMGLELGDIGVALFDPSDRIVWANNVFCSLFLVTPEAQTFSDIMHNCYHLECGPRIECDDINEWLATADAKRRSQLHRSFVIDIHDGRYFQVEENSFENGWLLDLFVPYKQAEIK